MQGTQRWNFIEPHSEDHGIPWGCGNCTCMLFHFGSSTLGYIAEFQVRPLEAGRFHFSQQGAINHDRPRCLPIIKLQVVAIGVARNHIFPRHKGNTQISRCRDVGIEEVRSLIPVFGAKLLMHHFPWPTRKHMKRKEHTHSLLICSDSDS